jgi:hypothetical protein
MIPAPAGIVAHDLRPASMPSWLQSRKSIFISCLKVAIDADPSNFLPDKE